ncbi:MAG: ComF family protein [Sphingomonadaceae bacterium]|nr:ComF family protein [Sphingomonadaceae bacterium]
MLAHFRPVLDFMLPPRCPGCGAIVEADHRFFAKCWDGLVFLTGGGCALCGAPVPTAELICGPCLLRPPRHDGVIAAVAYGEVARSVVLRLKYARRPGLARTIAGVLRHRAPLDPAATLVPVPLHRWRLRSRGFNQSLAIARALARGSGLACDPALIARRRATPSLRGLDPATRRKTVQGAFRVRGNLAGGHIYLVDDVYTTGATANACAAALKRAGAERVTTLCWARVTRHD